MAGRWSLPFINQAVKFSSCLIVCTCCLVENLSISVLLLKLMRQEILFFFAKLRFQIASWNFFEDMCVSWLCFHEKKSDKCSWLVTDKTCWLVMGQNDFRWKWTNINLGWNGSSRVRLGGPADTFLSKFSNYFCKYQPVIYDH